MSAIQEKLARIKNRTTKYELVATNKTTGQKVLVGYTQKGRPGLLNMLRKNAEEAVALLAGGVDRIDFAKKASDGATMGDWLINFSGRTQREAIIGGELVFFVDALPS